MSGSAVNTGRIQKVLAAAGVGSRRQIEAWIEAGRVLVNGHPAVPGQPIGPGDRVSVDGRFVRLRLDREPAHRIVAYHRPAGEPLAPDAARITSSSLERLPKPQGRRWLAVSPLSAADAGLELLLTDGELHAALSRAATRWTQEYSLRLRGGFDEARIAQIVAAAAADAEAQGEIVELQATGGEAANRWARAVVRGLRPRDLKRIFESCGIEANRILRTRLGPLAMDRALARGVHRALTEGEIEALREAAGVARRRPERKAAPSAGSDRRRSAPAKNPTAAGTRLRKR
jgi:23S rRNA pseudouridine2605 synthase